MPVVDFKDIYSIMCRMRNIYVTIDIYNISAIIFIEGTNMTRIQHPKESRQDRFKRIAAARTQKILDLLRLLGNCSNKSAYAYNNEDVSKIFSAIEKKTREVRGRFTNRSESKFEL